MTNQHVPRSGRGRRHSVARGAAISALLAMGALTYPIFGSAAPPDAVEQLVQKADAQDTVHVIVGFSLPGRPYQLESNLPGKAAVGQQRAAIAQQQSEIQAELGAFGAQTRRTYVTLPYIALSVNGAALEYLLKSPRITSIEEIEEYDVKLSSTGQWIGSAHAWGALFGGTGQSVAIIDTGIDRDHPFYSGGGSTGTVNRVVDEACFSSSDADATLCPDGSDEQYGPGAAHVVGVANCYDNQNPGTGNQICDHGAHVAGIAAGQDDGSRGYDGVAPKAGIVAIQAAHRVDDCDEDMAGDQPCVRFSSDNTVKGLDWVRLYSDVHTNVAAVNMSLGGGFNFVPCTGSAQQTAIQNLKAAGIATVISAGNDHWTWATGGPGCIPEAVTVSSVYDSTAPAPPFPDDVRHNMAYWVDLMAVGVSVDSSIPDDTWDNKGGTSMATPQVTGAFAVLRAIDPAMSVDEIEQLLKDTGVLVMDQRTAFPLPGDDDFPEDCDPPDCQPRTGQVKPRMQLDLAIAAITSADLSILKDCKPDGIKPIGEFALCHLMIKNLGPHAAMDVQVVDTFISDGSANFEFGSLPSVCTGTSNPQNPSGTVTCNLEGMQKDQVVELTIPVRANAPLNVDNWATVSSRTPDPFQGNNEAADDLNFGPARADLSITKSDTPDPVIAGENVTYNLVVNNAGPSPAEGVVVTDELPAGVSLVSATPSTGSCGVSIAVCNLGTLGNGASASIEIVAKVDPDTAAGTTLVNNAVVSSDTLDPDNANNNAMATTSVVTSADLKVAKSSDQDVYKPSSQVTYVIGATNHGPSVARDVVIFDYLPEVRHAIYQSDTGNCVREGASDPTTLRCELGDLAVGESRTFFVTVLVRGNKGTVANTVEIESATDDPNAGNDSATRTVVVGK